MPAPRFTVDQVHEWVPSLTAVGQPLRGGQKQVFPCRIDGAEPFALMVMSAPLANLLEEEEEDAIETIVKRAAREWDTLNRCNIDQLPRIGPIPFHHFRYREALVVLFSEEYIEGTSLDALLQADRLSDGEVLNLIEDLTLATKEIWQLRRIHRDIKPNNVIRRSRSARFVLLDAGIAFDLDDESLTSGGIVRTKGYIAPELFNPLYKKEADARADFFLIGVVAYLATTGAHPFMRTAADTDHEIHRRIIHERPPDPRALNPAISETASGLILRLLQTVPHRRFRDHDQLLTHIRVSQGNQ